MKFCVRNKNRIKQKFHPRSSKDYNDQAVSCDLFHKNDFEERRQSVLLGIFDEIPGLYSRKNRF